MVLYVVVKCPKLETDHSPRSSDEREKENKWNITPYLWKSSAFLTHPWPAIQTCGRIRSADSEYYTAAINSFHPFRMFSVRFEGTVVRSRAFFLLTLRFGLACMSRVWKEDTFSQNFSLKYSIHCKSLFIYLSIYLIIYLRAYSTVQIQL
jgi:hypothetical protein